MARRMEDIGDEKLRDMFEDAFNEKISEPNNMSDCEAQIIRKSADAPISVEVLVTGMAGSPSIDDFKNDNVEDARSLTVELDGYESMTFKLAVDQTAGLTSNDYHIVYEVEA
jgi:hypothetical protein